MKTWNDIVRGGKREAYGELIFCNHSHSPSDQIAYGKARNKRGEDACNYPKLQTHILIRIHSRNPAKSSYQQKGNEQDQNIFSDFPIWVFSVLVFL